MSSLNLCIVEEILKQTHIHIGLEDEQKRKQLSTQITEVLQSENTPQQLEQKQQQFQQKKQRKLQEIDL